MKTAISDFQLNTMDAVTAFINNNGLEKPQYIGTRDWENNPDPKNNPILVDSYNFFSGPTYGYLAFFYNPKTGKWNIKSFKENDKVDPRPLSEIARLAKEKK